MFFVCVYPGTRSISSFFWNSRQRKCETYLFKLINNSQTNCNQQRETVISSSIQFNNRKKQTLPEKNVDRVQHFWAIGISGTDTHSKRCMAQVVYLMCPITFRKEERRKILFWLLYFHFYNRQRAAPHLSTDMMKYANWRSRSLYYSILWLHAAIVYNNNLF